MTYSVPSTERLLNAKHFSRLPPKSLARQEALWQDTLREGSVRALCQGREQQRAYLPLKRSSPRPQFYRRPGSAARQEQPGVSEWPSLALLHVLSRSPRKQNGNRHDLCSLAVLRLSLDPVGYTGR